MIYEIRKHSECAPGTWWWMKGQAGPTVSCPVCQKLHMLPLVAVGGEELFHAIAADGTVSPSVICTRCDWHDRIRLEGWTARPCS